MTELSQRIDDLPPVGLGDVADRKTRSRLIGVVYVILLTIALMTALPAPHPVLSGTVSVESNLPLSPAIVRTQLALNALGPEWQARKPYELAASVGSGPHSFAPAISIIDADRVGVVRCDEFHITSTACPDRHFDARAPPSANA